MSPIRTAFWVALAAGLPGSALAETTLISSPPRVLALDPEAAGSKVLRDGEVLWKIPLRWPRAAILEEGAQFAADDRRRNLAIGEVMAETRLRFDDPALGNAASYCVARLADPNKRTLGMIGGLLARSLTDGQFCIVDKDRDGVAEMSVLINAGSPAARMPTAMKPIRYRTDVGVEVGGGDYARLVYRGGKSMELEFFQQGSKRRFDSFTTTNNFGEKESYSAWIRRVKLDDGQQVFLTPKGLIYLKSHDSATRTATVEWNAMPRFKLLPVPDEVQTRVRFY